MSNPEIVTNGKADLIAEVLLNGNSIRLRTMGVSMLPSLWPTDVVRVESIARAKVCAGDIGLFKRGDRLTIHRIVGKARVSDKNFWISRGDSMPSCDPPFFGEELLGRVSAIERHGRELVPRRNISLATRGIGWLLCKYATLRNVALRVHGIRTVRDLPVLNIQKQFPNCQ